MDRLENIRLSFSDGIGKVKRGSSHFSQPSQDAKDLPPMYPSPLLLRGCHEAACVLHSAVLKQKSIDRGSTVTQHALELQA